jgi:hypothetical protein
MNVVYREFGISRKTGYMTFSRYKDFCLRGLEDRAQIFLTSFPGISVLE